MKLQIIGFLLLFSMLIVSCTVNKQNKSATKSEKMFIRIAEIEIDSNYLNEYIAILKEESQASIKIEVGVISIYPMYQKENPNTIKIWESVPRMAARRCERVGCGCRGEARRARCPVPRRARHRRGDHCVSPAHRYAGSGRAGA